jgi:hypothetical protein
MYNTASKACKCKLNYCFSLVLQIIGVSTRKMLGQVSRVSFHTKIRKKSISIYISKQFSKYISHFVRTQSLRFLYVGTQNPSVCIQNWKQNDISPKNFYASQTICNLPGTFKTVRESMIRCVHACIDSGGRYCERLLWIETWQRIRTQALFNWEYVFYKCYVSCK